MARNVRVYDCPPEAVFDVFRDGWLFPVWVVGASRMRAMDRSWPAEGSRIHHSFGAWPLLIDDTTSMLEWDPPHRMRIQARGWPLGEAQVEVTVEPHRRGCRVVIRENPSKGPGTLVPGFLMQPMLFLRNIETLRRLGLVAVGRWALRTGAEPRQ